MAKHVYQKPFVGGSVALCLLVANAWFAWSPHLKANRQISTAKTQARIDSESRIAEIDAAERVNEARRAAGLDPSHSQLKLFHYEYNPHVFPTLDLSGYSTKDVVRVVDKHSTCVGSIRHKIFTFKGAQADICN